MAQTLYVKNGEYIDHQIGRRWLLPTAWANVMTNALGIAVTIAAARAFRIVLRFIVVLYQSSRTPPPGNVNIAMQGGHSFIDTATATSSPESFGWHGLLSSVLDARQFPGAVSLSSSVPRRRRCSLGCGGIVITAVLSLLFYVAAQVCGVFMARLQTTNVALSSHPDCGVYYSNIDSNPELLRNTDPYESRIQEESGIWAKTCYGKTSRPDGCNQFLYEDIGYSSQNASCPWLGGLCHADGEVALRLTTGAVDARRIGVNTPTKLEFNRTTVCSPLNMNETFIPPYHRNGSVYTWRYYYGESRVFGNASWLSRRWSDVGDVPTYLVNGGWYDPTAREPGWVPLPLLRPPDGSTLTFLYILPQNIRHTIPSYDTVFPAYDESTVNGTTYYMNLQGKGTVMGCVDTTLWRYPRFDQTWHKLSEVYNDMPSSLHDQAAFRFFTAALLSSQIWTSFSRRLAGALDAQSRIVGFVSMPLAKEQWKLEAEQLFKTSLARIQFTAHNIARGLQKQPGWVKSDFSDGLCHETYLFNATGWSNITPSWSIFIFVMTFVLIILALPMPDDMLFPEWLWANRGPLLARIKSVWHRLQNSCNKKLDSFSSRIVAFYTWSGWADIPNRLLTGLENMWDSVRRSLSSMARYGSTR